MSCTYCTLGDPPCCDDCFGASEPTGDPCPTVIYRIVHLPSGDYYCGKHKLPPGHPSPFIDDNYPFNDPKRRTCLVAKLSKYPRSEFRKDILAVCPTEASAYALERALIGPEQVSNPKCLNLVEGGRGAVGPSEETKAKQSAIQLKRFEDPTILEAQAERNRALAETGAWQEANLRAASRPGKRAKQSASQLKRYTNETPDREAARRRALSVGALARYEDPAELEAHRVRCRATEAREENRARTLKRYEDPAAREETGNASRRTWGGYTSEEHDARVAKAVEGKRRAKAERARVRSEVAQIFAALIVQKYAA